MARSIVATVAAPCTGFAADLRLSAAVGIAVAPLGRQHPDHADAPRGDRAARRARRSASTWPASSPPSPGRPRTGC